jgi:hypothetical protein
MGMRANLTASLLIITGRVRGGLKVSRSKWIRVVILGFGVEISPR